MLRLYKEWWLVLAAAAAGCAVTFPCSSDEQCDRDGVGGVCQASGYCSFPDNACESTQRYGELAPAELAGTCVPVGDDEGSGTATLDTESGATLTPTATVTSLGSLSGSSEGDTTEADTTEGEDESSSSGGIPACCYAGCEGTCEEVCADEMLGGPAVMQEAIGVAVIGSWVVWSTGYGQTLRVASLESGTDMELAMVPGNSFVTKVAADDNHVYFVDYGGPSVKRISVPEGAIDLVTEVPDGQAMFGGIAVGEQHVYFAMRGSGGIWRADKDLSDQSGAEMFAAAGQPFDVVLDDTHVYWIESNMMEEIWRRPLDASESPALVYQGADLTTLTVDRGHLYAGDGGTVLRMAKDGVNEEITPLANDQGFVWDIAVDEVHVYWTSASGNQLVRTVKDGSEQLEVLADTPEPWSLDLGCDAVYWAANGDQTLRRRLK